MPVVQPQPWPVVQPQPWPETHPLWVRLSALCRELSAKADRSLDKAQQEPSCGWHPGRAQGLNWAYNKLHAILYSDDAAEIRPPGQKVGPTEGPPPVSTVGEVPNGIDVRADVYEVTKSRDLVFRRSSSGATWVDCNMQALVRALLLRARARAGVR